VLDDVEGGLLVLGLFAAAGGYEVIPKAAA